MTAKERQNIVSILSKRIRKDGSIKLSTLKQVFVQENIEILYPTSGPKKWITDNFPEFTIMGNNGYEYICLEDDVYAKAWKIIEAELCKSGKLLLAVIPNMLKSHPDGINYKLLAKGMKLGEWLESTFPDFKISDDNLWLLHRKEGNNVSKLQENDTDNDMENDSENDFQEIQQMHLLAYMNWWNVNIKKIRVYNDNITEEEAKRSIARQIALILLGKTDSFINGMYDDEPKIAFDTGLRKEDSEEAIYCIFMPNPKYQNGEKQKFVQSGFCCASDGTELGNWIKSHLSSTKSRSDFKVLEEKADIVSEKMEGMITFMSDYLNRLKNNKLPSVDILEKVVDFEKACSELKAIYGDVWKTTYPDEYSINQIKESANEKTAIVEQITNTIQELCTIIQKTHDLFLEYKIIECQDDSILLKDKKLIEDKFIQVFETNDFEVLLSTIRLYKELRIVMQAKSMSDDGLFEILENVTAHFFPEFAIRRVGKLLIGFEENEISYLMELEDIEFQMKSWQKKASHEENETQTKKAPKPEELLEKINEYAKDLVAIHEVTSLICGYNAVVKMLVFGEFDELIDYFEKKKDDPLCSKEGMELLCGDELSKDLTLLEAAERLYRVIGNYERIAEMYYLLALPFAEEKIIPILLELYKNENNDELYLEIFNLYSSICEVDLDKEVWYLGILADKYPMAVLAYVKEHSYLKYQRQCIEKLLLLPDDVIGNEEKQKLLLRKERFENISSMNEFEKAIFENDNDAIERIILQENKLLEMGYSECEIADMRQNNIFRTSTGNDTVSVYETGEKFYQYQKNKNSLAEYYMWKGIAEKKTIAAKTLMELLVEENRHVECCDLYESFRSVYSENQECKSLYLFSKIKNDPLAAIDYVKLYLQDCMNLINLDGNGRIKDEICILKDNSNKEIARFYSHIYDLNESFADPLVKSIVCLERTLREYSEAQTAKKFGVSDKYATTFTQLYLADSYSHGMDAYSIASRLFVLVGTYKGAAEAYVKLALPELKAVKLLWDIHYEMNNDNELIAILQEYPALKQEKSEMYLDLLFEKELYLAFLSECSMKSNDWTRTLQLFVAELKVVPDDNLIEMPDVCNPENREVELNWYKKWGALLIRTLNECNRIEDIKEILFKLFNEWMTAFSRDLLRKIVTGNEMLDDNCFLEIQKEAIEREQIEIALYIYNILNIGELGSEAEEYYLSQREHFETLPLMEKLNNFKNLKMIFGDTISALDGEMALLEIRIILDDARLNDEEKAAEISKIVEALPTDENTIGLLFSKLKNNSICANRQVCNGLIGLAKTDELKRQLILLLESLGNRDDLFKDVENQQNVYLFYADALEKGVFPEEVLFQVEERCIKYIRKNTDNSNKIVECMLCLYYIKLQEKRQYSAEYLLLLVDYPTDNMEEQIRNRINEIRTKTWGDKSPSFFALFKKVLSDYTIEEIKDYLVFVNSISIPPETPFLLDFADEEQDRMLSEDESNILIKHFYCSINDREMWKKITELPLKDEPEAYSKLKYLNCTYNPKACKECAGYCEKYELNELLFKVLLVWSKSESDYMKIEFRQFLEERIQDNSEYLLKWSDKILELVKAVCVKSKGDSHSLIKAALLIAEKSNDAEALRYFVNYYETELYGSNCNLGVVLVAHLIQDLRYNEAKEIINRLNKVLSYMNYRELISQLDEMDEKELMDWAECPENQIMLQLILPDGNLPNIESINEVTDDGIKNGHIAESINAIKQALAIFKDDYGLYNALYVLSSTEPMLFIPELHRSLQGLVRLRPSNGAEPFYSYSQEDYAYMLATMDVLCIINKWTDKIDGYDFTKNAGEYYMSNVHGMDKEQKSASISKKQEAVFASFENRNQVQIDFLTKAYLGAITGNWIDLVESAWKQKDDISFEINVSAGGAYVGGVIRSIFRVLLGIKKERQKEFINWIEHTANMGCDSMSPRKKEIAFAATFFKEGYFSVLENHTEFDSLEGILLHPFECYSMSSKWKKMYIDSLINKNADTELLFAMTWMVSALIRNSYFQTELHKKADYFFNNERDNYACVFYNVLNLMGRKMDVVEKWDNERGLLHLNKIRKLEIYETRYRITALFSEEAAIKAKVCSPNFHPWSCLNMVLSMLYSKRADEIIRLSKYFDKKNRQLVEDILKAFDPSVEDADKLELMNNRANDVEKAYFCYVVKHPYNLLGENGENLNSHALTDSEVKRQFYDEYIKLARKLMYNKVITGHLVPSHHLLLEKDKPNEKAFWQKESSIWKVSNEVLVIDQLVNADETSKGEAKKISADELPLFAKDIIPESYEGDIQELFEMHKSLSKLAGDIREKLRLSRIICKHYLKESDLGDDIAEILLMYANDSYYYAVSEKNNERANALLMEMAKLIKEHQPKGHETENAKVTLQEGILPFIKSFDELQTLLSSYEKYRNELYYVKSYITDGLINSCVTKVFEVLDSLNDSYLSVERESQEILRKKLTSNYLKLEDIENNRWMEIKNRVQKLINDEMNALDQRPVLQFRILNEGVQPCFGNLFGEVVNIGKVAAESIVIQATYGDGSSSNQYILKQLSPGGKAVYELDYSFGKSTNQISFVVNARYLYSDKNCSETVSKGEIVVGDIQEPEYPTGLLTRDSNGILFSVDKINKTVFSSEFVGRKNETAWLRELVSGNSFEEYKSALMYGVRRTGKTSLLNYFEAYLGVKYDNVICVKIDCQANSSQEPIQFVFIDTVIDTIERKLPNIKTEQEWIDLKTKWGKDYFSADQQPEKLSLFYLDVKELIGDKGVFLIIDEIDRLFERIINTQMKYNRNLDSLFGSISAILNDCECRKAVHMLICGSNWLIRYNLKGDIKNQLFQRFGKQVIEVGKLPEVDAREIVLQPYRSYPELNITDEAVKWIWDYAGGLVWHTKLLGEEAIERAKRNNRYVVYPSDVRQSLPKVITEAWCRQFYEGCEEGEERNVVDAMQSLANKKDAYVHINQLSELMKVSKVDLQRIINVLKELKILTAHPIDSQQFRFELDIYRRFFRTIPSSYEQKYEEPDVFQLNPTERGWNFISNRETLKPKFESVDKRNDSEDNNIISEDSDWYN